MKTIKEYEVRLLGWGKVHLFMTTTYLLIGSMVVNPKLVTESLPMRPGTREHPGETALRASWTRVKILYFFLKWERDYGRPMDIYDLADGQNGLPASSLPLSV